MPYFIETPLDEKTPARCRILHGQQVSLDEFAGCIGPAHGTHGPGCKCYVIAKEEASGVTRITGAPTLNHPKPRVPERARALRECIRYHEQGEGALGTSETERDMFRAIGTLADLIIAIEEGR